MKYLSEFRDATLVESLLRDIRATITRPWVLMEVCGGQTHAIVRHGLPELLPEQIELVHGPGCPVCVTPLEMIDRAVALTARPEIILTTYGDMMRVPGSTADLFRAKAAGGDVRTVGSPLEAVSLAKQFPDREVVFFAVGFETTAPASAVAVRQADQLGLTNFSIICAHVLVPPAMIALLRSPGCRVQGFLAAGHVCAVMGWKPYEQLATEFNVPVVVTGFEPVDLLAGIAGAIKQLESGRSEVENQYPRAVLPDGNQEAQALLADVFEPTDRAWRGIGVIPRSGYVLRPKYAGYDASQRFDVGHIVTRESPDCIAGLILQGLKKPYECPAFGNRCTPLAPLGATMVSSEGACAAYYAHHRRDINTLT